MSNMARTRAAAVALIIGTVSACGIPDEAATGGREQVLAHADPAAAPRVVHAVPDSDSATPVAAASSRGPTTATYEDALAVYRRGRYDESAVLFESVAAMHPADGQVQYMLGLSAWKSGDRGRAVEALTRAVELDETSVKARTNLARVLTEQGQPGDALPHIEKAVELTPESHEVWRVLGNVLAEMGRADDALESYRQALVRRPDDAWSANNYGLAMIRLGRYEEAVPALARAVELVPGSPVFQNNLGTALERTGRLQEARSAYAAAVAADSTYVRAATSLRRVEGLTEPEPVPAVDVSGLARRFHEQVEEWRSVEHYEC